MSEVSAAAFSVPNDSRLHDCVLKEFALARMLVAPLVFVFDALALSLCCLCVFSQSAVVSSMIWFV